MRQVECAVCGIGFTQTGPGRPAKKCEGCRPGQPKSPCQMCGGELPKNHGKWCSTRCFQMSKSVVPGRTQAQAREDQRNRSIHWRECECCGVRFKRRPSGEDRAKGYVARCCSMGCRVKLAANRRAAEAIFKAMVRSCPKPPPLPKMTKCPRPQRLCGCGMPTALPKARFCSACLGQRVKERAAIERKRLRSTPKGKAQKAAYKAQRRARERIRAELFDPIEVFERDKWRCQLCGIATPKSLKGTNEPTAPELDHVVTLADGGHHTRANTQCACRSCNSKKGASSLGQIGLDLGA